jgi:hypothetical protein
VVKNCIFILLELLPLLKILIAHYLDINLVTAPFSAMSAVLYNRNFIEKLNFSPSVYKLVCIQLKLLPLGFNFSVKGDNNVNMLTGNII